MITDVMAMLAPPELLGIHLNWAFAVPPDIEKAIQTGNPRPSDLSADERRACEQLDFFYKPASDHCANSKCSGEAQ